MTENVTLREYVETILNEHDKRNNQRFSGAELAVKDALASQEKATSAAFMASEKAIVKAEDAQRAYNVVHNDLSRKMDEQYKEMMPRPETLGLFKAVDGKFESQQKQIDELRLSKATLEGKASQQSVMIA